MRSSAVCLRRELTGDFNGGNRSSDGRLSLLREAERKVGLPPVGIGWSRAYAIVNYEQTVEPFLKTAPERPRASILMGGACAKAYGWSPKKDQGITDEPNDSDRSSSLAR
jgi:hypothetical protein